MNETRFLEFISNIIKEELNAYTVLTPKLFEELYNHFFNTFNTFGFENKIVDEHYTNFDNKIINQTNTLRENLSKAEIAIEENNTELIKSLKDELIKLKEELDQSKNIIYTDHLTTLHNRKWFNDYLTEDNKFIVNGILAFIDLNNFKKINDLLGHNIGDKVLQIAAHKLNQLEDCDIIRYAGDEFLIYTRTLRLTQLEAELEKILIYFKTKKLSIKGKNLDPSIAMIRFSFGLVKITHGDDVKEQIALADKKMYEDKLRRKSLDS